MEQYAQVDNDQEIAFVLANGLSRLRFAITQLHKHGTVYGCNRIYDDLIPDYIVSVDKAMIDIILMDDVQLKTNVYIDKRVYTAHYKNCTSLHHIDPQVSGIIGSGDLAMMLACEHKHTKIYMIGFDYVSKDGKINNVYTGKKPYKKVGANHTLPISIQNWYQKSTIVMERYKDVEFIRVNANDFVPPIANDNFVNIDVDSFNNLFPGIIDVQHNHS